MNRPAAAKGFVRYIGVCGTGAIIYGLYLIWHPLAWIVGGCILSYAATRALKETEVAPTTGATIRIGTSTPEASKVAEQIQSQLRRTGVIN